MICFLFKKNTKQRGKYVRCKLISVSLPKNQQAELKQTQKKSNLSGKIYLKGRIY